MSNLIYINSMNKNIKVGIIGAGIQGVSNALFLQKKGFNVTIFDRDNPGHKLHLMEMQDTFHLMLQFH